MAIATSGHHQKGQKRDVVTPVLLPMKSASVSHRLRRRQLPWVWVIVSISIVALVIYACIRSFSTASLWRQSIVVVADPMRIISWDAAKSHVVILEIPPDTQIEGTHGYGLYSLQSLYALDTIDKRRGLIFLDSVSATLGVPISGMVHSVAIRRDASPIEILRSMYSWKTFITPHSYQGVPLGTWIASMWAVLFLKTDAIEAASIDGAIITQSRPDGSVIPVLDSQRFDFLYARLFVDSAIRQEGVTVSVYNTTSTPTIGQRVARTLSTLGISVVTVGNDSEQLIPRCLLSGSKKILTSRTARFIHAYFHCEDSVVSSESVGGADLVVRLGRDYARDMESRK